MYLISLQLCIFKSYVIHKLFLFPFSAANAVIVFRHAVEHTHLDVGMKSLSIAVLESKCLEIVTATPCNTFVYQLRHLAWLLRFGLCCLMTPGLSKDIRCHV